MASNNNDDTPPQGDPGAPDYVCTNCHSNIFELCDACYAQIDVAEILENMRRARGATPTTSSNRSESSQNDPDPPGSPSIVESGVESDEKNPLSASATGGATNEPQSNNSPSVNSPSASGGTPSGRRGIATLISITQTGKNIYKYKYKYENETPRTPMLLDIVVKDTRNIPDDNIIIARRRK